MNEVRTTIPVSSGLVCQKHRAAIGVALWEFLWLVDKTTREQSDREGRWGVVLNGRPIEAEEIARVFGTHVQTVRRNLKNLEVNGYIRMTRVKGGLIILVRNSIKWLWRQQHGSGSSNGYTKPRPGGSGAKSLPGYRPSEVDWAAESRRGL